MACTLVIWVLKVINVHVHSASSWNLRSSDIACTTLSADEGLFFLLPIVWWRPSLRHTNSDYSANCVCRNGDVIISKWWRLWAVIPPICTSTATGDEDCIVMHWFSSLGRSRRRPITRVYTGRRGPRDIEYWRLVMQALIFKCRLRRKKNA